MIAEIDLPLRTSNPPAAWPIDGCKPTPTLRESRYVPGRIRVMGDPEKHLDTMPGPTLFRTVRLLGRAPDQQDQRKFSGILVVQAIRGSSEAGDQPEVTVRSVAVYMHVAPSTASRLVADAVSSGYVRSVQSKADRRSSVLKLTPIGKKLLNDSLRYQSTVYSNATIDWPTSEKLEFDRLLLKFCNNLIRDI